MPSRANHPEEGRVPCALPQAARECSRGMGWCNAEAVPGPVRHGDQYLELLRPYV